MPALSWADVAFGWAIMAAHAAFGARSDAKLARGWLGASLRAAVQLSALGYVLVFLFRHDHWAWNGLTLTSMIAVSAWTIGRRAHFVDALLSLVAALALVLGPAALWTWGRALGGAPFLVPFVGILLGNALSGVSLGLAQWHREREQRRAELEFWLSVGATPREAVREMDAAALKSAMTVILSAMAVSGIVSIPGQMTGQLLAGGDPQLAVRYQLVILFFIASVVYSATRLALLLQRRRAFDAWGALRP